MAELNPILTPYGAPSHYELPYDVIAAQQVVAAEPASEERVLESLGGFFKASGESIRQARQSTQATIQKLSDRSAKK